MRNLKIDATTGDIVVTGGNLDMVTGGSHVLQAVRSRLRFFMGEWFLDTRVGVPYFQRILVKLPNQAAIETAIKSAILGTPGVSRMVSYSQKWDRSIRKLVVSFSATTDDGETIASSEVLAA